MIKCPFCHKDNEDGALFCEQCTSDLSSVAPIPKAASAPPPVPVMPMAEALPMAEAMPMAEPIFAEAMPMALAEPVEELPMALAEPMAMPALELAPMPMAEPMPVEPIAAPAPAPQPMPAPTPVPAVSSAPPAPAPAPAAETPAGGSLPPGAQPRLLVLRGQKRNVEYPIYEGDNYIGRADEKPVDIDLEEQEPPDRIWCSRQHARVGFENNTIVIEDLNSANGTYVNRTRVYPGQIRTLAINDVVQIGNVQLKVLA